MERAFLFIVFLWGISLPQTTLADTTSAGGVGVEEGGVESGESAPTPAKAEEPKAEEPKAEEPKAEEPKAEEPKAKEPPKAEPPPKADVPVVQSHIESDDDAMAAVSKLMDAAKGGHWVLVVGLCISLLLYGARRFKILNKVPAKLVPYLAAILGVLWYLVPSLLKGGEGLQDAFTSGILAGLTAVGSWETVVKGLLKKKPAKT